jgi:hypothetical protein
MVLVVLHQATHGQHNRLRQGFLIHLEYSKECVWLDVWDNVKVQNLRVLKVVAEKNLLVIKGCVPGHNNSYVIIQVMEAKVLDFNGKDTEEKFNFWFSIYRANNHAVYLDVKQYLLIKVKERTKLKKELKLREVPVRLKQKKAGTAVLRVVQNPCLKVEEQFWTKTKKLFFQIE